MNQPSKNTYVLFSRLVYKDKNGSISTNMFHITNSLNQIDTKLGAPVSVEQDGTLIAPESIEIMFERPEVGCWHDADLIADSQTMIVRRHMLHHVVNVCKESGIALILG